MTTSAVSAPSGGGYDPAPPRIFLESLDQAQKAKATFDYMDGERMFLVFTRPSIATACRCGTWTQNQRELALAVMESGLTSRSYEQATQIIETRGCPGSPRNRDGDSHLRPRPGNSTISPSLGSPAPAIRGVGGWRATTCPLHFSVLGDRVVSVTPFFFGANPAEVRKGAKTGLRILGDREDIAFDLMSSFDEKANWPKP